MKNVLVLDSFRRVFDEQNNSIHDAQCSENIAYSNLTLEQAIEKVTQLFNETKELGVYTEVVSAPEQGVVEIKVEFTDKRQLHRVIYLKDV